MLPSAFGEARTVHFNTRLLAGRIERRPLRSSPQAYSHPPDRESLCPHAPYHSLAFSSSRSYQAPRCRRGRGRRQSDKSLPHAIFVKHARLLQDGRAPGFNAQLFELEKQSLLEVLEPPTLNNLQTNWTKFGAFCNQRGIPPAASPDNLQTFLVMQSRDPGGLVQKSKSIAVNLRITSFSPFRSRSVHLTPVGLTTRSKRTILPDGSRLVQWATLTHLRPSFAQS